MLNQLHKRATRQGVSWAQLMEYSVLIAFMLAPVTSLLGKPILRDMCQAFLLLGVLIYLRLIRIYQRLAQNPINMNGDMRGLESSTRNSAISNPQHSSAVDEASSRTSRRSTPQ